MTQVAWHGVVVDDECVFGWCTGLMADGDRCVTASRRLTARRVRQGGTSPGSESGRSDQSCNDSRNAGHAVSPLPWDLCCPYQRWARPHRYNTLALGISRIGVSKILEGS
jgi:hypothetical protein